MQVPRCASCEPLGALISAHHDLLYCRYRLRLGLLPRVARDARCIGTSARMDKIQHHVRPPQRSAIISPIAPTWVVQGPCPHPTARSHHRQMGRVTGPSDESYNKAQVLLLCLMRHHTMLPEAAAAANSLSRSISSSDAGESWW